MEKAKEARYRTIYKQLKDKIESGEYKQGNRLKTEKELQEEYGVSRDTIRRALSHLENEDYIVKRPALGTFVKQKKSDYQLSKMESFTEQMRRTKENAVPQRPLSHLATHMRSKQ